MDCPCSNIRLYLLVMFTLFIFPSHFIHLYKRQHILTSYSSLLNTTTMTTKTKTQVHRHSILLGCVSRILTPDGNLRSHHRCQGTVVGRQSELCLYLCRRPCDCGAHYQIWHDHRPCRGRLLCHHGLCCRQLCYSLLAPLHHRCTFFLCSPFFVVPVIHPFHRT